MSLEEAKRRVVRHYNAAVAGMQTVQSALEDLGLSLDAYTNLNETEIQKKGVKSPTPLTEGVKERSKVKASMTTKKSD